MNSELSRRDALRLCLAPLGVAAAGGLIVGCAADGQETDEENDPYSQLGGPDAGPGTAPATATDAGIVTSAVPWAVAGTKVMTPSAYPDPFASGSWGPACTIYPSMTLGPCYAQSPARREDISDGMLGLPLRVSFLVVRGPTCSPVPNAEVDIWHTGSNGTYSAFASGTCNPSRLPVRDQRFCRGTQLTNAQGRCDFNTIYPGHYQGRSIHIHFTVRAQGRDYKTSQLFFEDQLSNEILLTGEYKSRPPTRRTTNATDGILRGVNLASVVMSSAKRADGALHAWKVLSLPA